MNYDGFIDDVSVGDILLVDGGLQSLMITGKAGKDVHTEVVDGGIMKSRWAHCLTLTHLHCKISWHTCYLSRQLCFHAAWTGSALTRFRALDQLMQALVAPRVSSPLLHAHLAHQPLKSFIQAGALGSRCRRHLNIRGKSANLPAITERDWLDIKFGVDVGVDYYALSFVRNADVIYELKRYLAQQGEPCSPVAFLLPKASAVSHQHATEPNITLPFKFLLGGMNVECTAPQCK